MKFFRKLGFQLVLFFIVAITIPIVMLMVSSITTTSSSMENNVKVTSEQTLNEAQKQFTTYLKTLSQPVDLLTRKNEVKHCFLSLVSSIPLLSYCSFSVKER